MGALVNTSDREWRKAVTANYKNKQAFTLLDDAGVGVDPRLHTIIDMMKIGALSRGEVIATCGAAGMSAFGAGMVILAFVDPEPTSKLLFAIGAGATLVLGGGFAAIQILTSRKPPRVSVRPGGFEIAWD